MCIRDSTESPEAAKYEMELLLGDYDVYTCLLYTSFAVGMLNAFYDLKGKYADKKKLADEAIYLERVLCNESGLSLIHIC